MQTSHKELSCEATCKQVDVELNISLGNLVRNVIKYISSKSGQVDHFSGSCSIRFYGQRETTLRARLECRERPNHIITDLHN